MYCFSYIDSIDFFLDLWSTLPLFVFPLYTFIVCTTQIESLIVNKLDNRNVYTESWSYVLQDSLMFVVFQVFPHSPPGVPHLAVLSVDSACSDSVTSSGAASGPGFRMRKKRKQPTRLMTVREMNTVSRSLSGTHSSMSHMITFQLKGTELH